MLIMLVAVVMEEKKYAGYKDGKIVAKSKFGLNKMQYKVHRMVCYIL